MSHVIRVGASIRPAATVIRFPIANRIAPSALPYGGAKVIPFHKPKPAGRGDILSLIGPEGTPGRYVAAIHEIARLWGVSMDGSDNGGAA